MCLAMCLKKQEFQADCVYKLGVYKKKLCNRNQKFEKKNKSILSVI